MAMYDKPGAASGPRDRHTHYNDPYDRASREIRTVQKKIWGLDGLSKVSFFLSIDLRVY
jgi:hypothetical protein